MNELELKLLRIPAILLALTIHEYAHGFVALLKGDPTAKMNGRLSFNPLSHLDPFGAIMLFFGPFGWAKPVPVNYKNLDNPRWDSLYVSLAGPVSNIFLGLIFGFLLRILVETGVASQLPELSITFLKICISINFGLSFFNLLPIPPLDGSHILLSFVPVRSQGPYLRFLDYAPKVLFGLIIAEWLLRIPVFSMIMNPFWIPYMGFWQWVIFGSGGVS